MTPISGNVRRFLASSISSVPQLEALLLLCADGGAARDWDGATIASRIYQSERDSLALLDELAGLGLLERVCEAPLRFRYAPGSPEISAVVREVAAAYATHLVEITQFIHAKRDVKAVRFADAFRWRKE
ncbi:MAG: hypothetical protein ABIP49_00865 [Lysobacterales bacterium]